MKKKVLSVLLAGCICCPTMMNIGDSTIRVKAIDHSQKTITLETVKETADLTDYIKDFDSLEKAPTDVMFSGNQVLIRFHLMVQKNGCVIEPDKVKWEVSGTANSAFDGNSFTKIESYDETYAIAYCLLTVNSPGTVCVKGTEINSSSGAETPLYWNFNVIEDGNFDGTVTYDKPVVLSGDVNADGSFSIADVVMLQKWILGIPDVTLPNWEAADLCEDGVLNVFDLCMMKRELISQKRYDDTPVLLVDDYIMQIAFVGNKNRKNQPNQCVPQKRLKIVPCFHGDVGVDNACRSEIIGIGSVSAGISGCSSVGAATSTLVTKSPLPSVRLKNPM